MTEPSGVPVQRMITFAVKATLRAKEVEQERILLVVNGALHPMVGKGWNQASSPLWEQDS